jgi:SAM-dependent methyltransferase
MLLKAEELELETVACTICASDGSQLWKRIDQWRLVRCDGCGLIYLNPRPTAESIRRVYQEAYFADRDIQYPSSGEQIEREIESRRVAIRRLTRETKLTGRFLDVGCAAGFLVAAAQREGWQAVGVDVSDWSTRFAREQLGLDARTGNLEELDFEAPFDLIVMSHVAEHLPNPLRTLKAIYSILKPGGVLVVRGPNVGSFDRIWHGRAWRGYELPLHFYHFDVESYRRIMSQAGLNVYKIEPDFWNPVKHVSEALSGDGLRADHKARPSAARSFAGARPSALGAIKEITRAGLTRVLTGRDISCYGRK